MINAGLSLDVVSCEQVGFLSISDFAAHLLVVDISEVSMRPGVVTYLKAVVGNQLLSAVLVGHHPLAASE